jgi:hypothetical protein
MFDTSVAQAASSAPLVSLAIRRFILALLNSLSMSLTLLKSDNGMLCPEPEPESFFGGAEESTDGEKVGWGSTESSSAATLDKIRCISPFQLGIFPYLALTEVGVVR